MRDLRTRICDHWPWDMSWSRNFFVWEEALVGQLLELVGVVVLREEDEKSDSAKCYCFILKSAY